MNWEQVFAGLALAVPATMLGYLTYRASRKKDAVSAQSGVVSDHRAGIEQIIKGYDLLLDQAQETIKDDAAVKKLLEERIEKFVALLEACNAKNARLLRKYGATDA